MMKKRMMPVSMSPKASFRPKSVAISLAPRSRNTSRKLASTMKTGLNLASQDTMTAVKPRLSESEVVIVWSVPATSRKPARPHSAPEMSIVRMITRSTLMPT